MIKLFRPLIETYANTHSKEASMAPKTNSYYRQAHEHLKSLLELDDGFAIIPTGCGAMAAVKRFQEILGIYIPLATRKRGQCTVKDFSRPLVILGPYAHHSDEISYREAVCDRIRIGLDDQGCIDLDYLELLLQINRHRVVIGIFCIDCNVTGIITQYEAISNLLRQYKALVCFDVSSSIYLNVPSHLYDVIFLSPHKLLLCGPGSCGILVIRKALLTMTV